MKLFCTALLALVFVSTNSVADEYVIDKKGIHSFLQFNISPLGYSWLSGRFTDFDCHFSYDCNTP